jgi:hypothetical protein
MQVRYRRGIAALEWEWTEEGVIITPSYSGMRGVWDRFAAWMVEASKAVAYSTSAWGQIRGGASGNPRHSKGRG